MFQAIVDSRLLEAVSSWLEPMRPSGSLPAEGIQKAIFEVLPRVRLAVADPVSCLRAASYQFASPC